MGDGGTRASVLAELKPFPGRGLLAFRLVVAVLFAATLVMAFRMPVLGWLSLYFCIALAKDGSLATYFTCAVIVVAVAVAVFLALLLLKFVAEPDWLRLLCLALVLFGGFFLARGMSDGDLMRDFTIAMAIVLTLPDVAPYPHLWERAALWIFPITIAGAGSIALATALFPPERAAPGGRPAEGLPKITLAPDLFRNPIYAAYALKGTLAAMATYFVYTLLNLQQIHTAIVTCLIVALPTTAAIVHKSRLRITGALIGAAFSLWATVFVIPRDEAFGGLLAVLGAGTFVAAWVAVGSERIAYAGWQIGLAQFMMLAHGFGPTTDLSILRDRLLGILLGNLMMALVFVVLWPDRSRRIGRRARAPASAGVAALAALFLLPGCGSVDRGGGGPDAGRPAPNGSAYELASVPEADESPGYDPDRAYTLAALIDFAQSNRPETRAAWESAKAAAESVGVARSAFAPEVSLALLGAYERQSFPLPREVFPAGEFTADFAQLRPQVGLQWLVFDSGRRSAAVETARRAAAAKAFALRAEHRTVVFEVTEAFYGVVEAKAVRRVADSSLEDARLLEEAAQAGFDQGLVAKPDLLRARQAVAQARFDLAEASGDLRSARAALAQAAGMDPSRPPKVAADLGKTNLPRAEGAADEMVRRALRNRSDLKAEVAAYRAAEAAVEEARAGAGPVLVAGASGGPVVTGFQVEGDPWIDETEPLFTAGLALRWTVFDGERRAREIRVARAEADRLRVGLRGARDEVAREVWTAFIDFENAWERLRAARALVAAAESSHEASLEAFENGLSTVNDVQTAQTALAGAQESLLSARLEVLESHAVLRLAAGDPLSAADPAAQRDPEDGPPARDGPPDR